ncbi:MAG: uracil-DNA glycosylase [Eubacteriaceae bacterium]|nr:uracil-DNA glycosylase [Eubacteriaceae bacterium]
MAVLFENDWGEILREEFEKDYYKTLRVNLAAEYKNHQVFPDMYDIFNAFHLTSFEDTKVVILGQDPYHDDMQAHGLSFSVMKGVDIPPSLRNIYKELNEDLGCDIPQHGCLVKWAEEGVLLLNSVLTVRAHQAASHKNLGWQNFTDSVISILNDREKPVVFILWGAYAQSKEVLITSPQHLIIKSPHPSPLSASRGFFGSRPFSKANDFLIKNGFSPIDWQID